MSDEEIEMNWLAVCESGSMTAIHNLREHYKQLEKKKAELEEIRSGQVIIINNDTVRIERLKKEIAELKAHCKAVDEVNEKMKCCTNCKHHNFKYLPYYCNINDNAICSWDLCDKWELAE